MTTASSSPTETPLDVTISIVSYNTCGPLRDCLTSLRGAARRRRGVSGCGGCGQLLDRRQRRNGAPRVPLGASRRNRRGNIGYGRANNAGLAGATSRYFFVLNSDTEVEPGALKVMRDFMDSRADVGCVGAQLILSDGSTQTSCARDPSLLAVFWGTDLSRPSASQQPHHRQLSDDRLGL